MFCLSQTPALNKERVNIFFPQNIPHDLPHSGYFLNFIHMGTTENKTVFHIPLNGPNQRIRNTIGNCGRIAIFQALSAMNFAPFSPGNFFEKSIFQAAPRHTHWTF